MSSGSVGFVSSSFLFLPQDSPVLTSILHLKERAAPKFVDNMEQWGKTAYSWGMVTCQSCPWLFCCAWQDFSSRWGVAGMSPVRSFKKLLLLQAGSCSGQGYRPVNGGNLLGEFLCLGRSFCFVKKWDMVKTTMQMWRSVRKKAGRHTLAVIPILACGEMADWDLAALRGQHWRRILPAAHGGPDISRRLILMEARTLRGAGVGMVHCWKDHSLQKGPILAGEVQERLYSMREMPCCQRRGLQGVFPLRRKGQQEQCGMGWNWL